VLSETNYIKIESDIIIDACQMLIDEIDQERDRMVEDEVHRLMNRRFFRAKSHSEAIDMLTRKSGSIKSAFLDMIYEDVSNPFHHRCDDLCDAEEIQSMARLSDAVYLTQWDARLLSEFIMKVKRNRSSDGNQE